MSYERVESAEPAVLAGLVTSLAGFLALLASDFSALHSAAVAVGMSGTQALLTRPFVYSPESIKAFESGRDLYGRIPELLKTGTGFAHPHEPAVTIGTLSLLGGFLVQVFTGVDFLAASASAAGIAGVQTAATRARVYSPVSARSAVAGRLYAETLNSGAVAKAGGV
jgi:predicted exporter